MEGKSACFKVLSKGGYVLGTQFKTIEKKRKVGYFGEAIIKVCLYTLFVQN